MKNKDMSRKDDVETTSPNTTPGAGQAKSGAQTFPVSRRRTLKTALVGGAVISAGSIPAKWSAPVVNSVVLPAHGATSVVTGPWSVTFPQGLDQEGQVNVTPLNPEPPAGPLFALKSQFRQSDGKTISGTARSLARVVADTLIPSANADIYIGQAICVERTDSEGGIAVKWVDFITEDDSLYTSGSVLFEGTGALGETIQLGSDCEIADFQYPIELTELPDGSLEFIAEEGDYEGIIPEGSCGIAAGNCPEILGEDEPQ